jgi:ParB family transcriptional regulator, chromosome partitioning protein
VSILLPIDAIDPDPNQPRKLFAQDTIADLADSIKAVGLLQPITVRPSGSRFVLIAGERRWRAHRLLADDGQLNPPVIAAHVRHMTSDDVAIAAIVENLQRVDVTALEESDAFARLVAAGMEPEEIAKRCGIALFRVTWRLSLQNLQPEIRQLLATGNLDQQAANEIARLTERRDQGRMLKLCTSGKLVGWKAVRSAVDAVLEKKTQVDLFGEAPRASDDDLEKVHHIEQRVDRMAAMCRAGWDDGECRIAVRVSRDRARLVADKLAAIRSSLGVMERELRRAHAQAEIVMGEVA